DAILALLRHPECRTAVAYRNPLALFILIVSFLIAPRNHQSLHSFDVPYDNHSLYGVKDVAEEGQEFSITTLRTEHRSKLVQGTRSVASSGQIDPPLDRCWRAHSEELASRKVRSERSAPRRAGQPF